MSVILIKRSLSTEFYTPKKLKRSSSAGVYTPNRLKRSPPMENLTAHMLPLEYPGFERNYKILCSENHIGYSKNLIYAGCRRGLCDSCIFQKSDKC